MSSFVDRQGRLFGKISLVDIVIVLAVIALVLLAFVRFARPDAAEVPVITTLVVERVRIATIIAVQEGMDVYDEGGAFLGRVESVVEKPSPVDVVLEHGADAPVLPPDRLLAAGESKINKDVTLTIRGTGQRLGEDIVVGGVILRVGKALLIHGPGYEIKTVVQGARPVDGT